MRNSPKSKDLQYLNIPYPSLNRDEQANLKNLFKLYDHNKEGRIEPNELVLGLKNYGINNTCPQLFSIVSGLDTAVNNADGITFPQLLEEINEKFGNKMDKKEVKRIFELFLKDKTQESIYLADLKNTCAEMNLDYLHHDLLMMLKDSSALKNEMTFEEFNVMMTEKLIHIN